MANTEIDSLSLEIEVKGLNKDDINNLDKLSRAVARLSKSLNEADFSKLKDIKVPKGLKDIQFITQNIKQSFGSGNSVNETNEELQETTEILRDYADGVEDVAVSVEDSSLKIQKGTEVIKVSNRQAIKTLKDLIAELEGKKKKTGIEKLLERLGKTLKRFKTIAFIKAVRGLINAIVQSIQAGIMNLAQFDKAFNETMSKIKTASTTLSNSLALTFRPLIETLQPFITQASQTLANVGNEISKIQASMQGLSKYTKINAKYMDDYANATKKSQLFSFDTFNTLDTGSTNNMFEEEAIDNAQEGTKGLVEFITEIQNLLSNLSKLLGTIFKEIGKIIKFITPGLSIIFGIINDIFDVVIPLIDGIFESLNPIIESILVNLLPPLLQIVRDVLQPIFQLITTLTPIITLIVDVIAQILAPVINSIGSAINAIEPIVNVIATIVSFIVDLLGTSLADGLKFVLTLLQPILDAIKWISDTFGVFMEAIHDLFNADFEGFADKIVLFFKKAFWGLVKFLASMIDGTINAIIEGINTIFLPLNKLSEWFEWGWEVGITWRSNLADLVPSYADGGFVGELWQMNEYGNPEMLYNANNNGNTAVINQAQLSLAFEQAIYNTGLLDVIAQAGIINIDGRAIAQSTNFKNEINRTNPGLNIR